MAAIVSRIVEICVFRIIRSEPQFLVLQRAADEILYPNMWQIVTGKLKEKERAFDTVIRELKEETDLKIKRYWTVPFIDSYFDTSADTVQLAPVFAAEVDGAVEVKLSSEHQDFKWAAYQEAIDMLVWPGQREALKIVKEFIINGNEAASLSEIKQS